MSYVNQRIAYGKTLVELGHKNPNIVVLDADLGGSTMGKMFEQEFPDRHYEMGMLPVEVSVLPLVSRRQGKSRLRIPSLFLRPDEPMTRSAKRSASEN